MDNSVRGQVLDAVREGVYRFGRDETELLVFAANDGRPDGRLVTDKLIAPFRQYRNRVSGSPRRLVDEALGLVGQDGEVLKI